MSWLVLGARISRSALEWCGVGLVYFGGFVIAVTGGSGDPRSFILTCKLKYFRDVFLGEDCECRGFLFGARISRSALEWCGVSLVYFGGFVIAVTSGSGDPRSSFFLLALDDGEELVLGA